MLAPQLCPSRACADVGFLYLAPLSLSIRVPPYFLSANHFRHFWSSLLLLYLNPRMDNRISRMRPDLCVISSGIWISHRIEVLSSPVSSRARWCRKTRRRSLPLLRSWTWAWTTWLSRRRKSTRCTGWGELKVRRKATWWREGHAIWQVWRRNAVRRKRGKWHAATARRGRPAWHTEWRRRHACLFQRSRGKRMILSVIPGSPPGNGGGKPPAPAGGCSMGFA